MAIDENSIKNPLRPNVKPKESRKAKQTPIKRMKFNYSPIKTARLLNKARRNK